MVGDTVWLLRESPSGEIEYKVLIELIPKTENDCEDLLRGYFRLEVDLEQEYNKWCKAHSHFDDINQFHAVRVLNQDPVENLFSFICSQNNHISRISTMVEKLCSFYGEKIGEANGNDYYCFPDIDKLSAAGVEQKLRANGFGYRAKYIEKSAKEIHSKGGRKWFEQLVQMNYKEAHRNLTELSGIGPKVADCICLMSLGHLEAIPVDTHIFQIAQKHYMPNLKSAKSVTGKMYNEIGDKFRDIYGPLAGWTQTMLFCADLKQFQAGNDAKKAIKRKAT